MRPLAALSALLFTCVCAAQVALTGRVQDARTGEMLAFVPVNEAGTREGTLSDIDGRFSLTVPALPVRLRFSYVGYRTLEVEVADTAPLKVRLEQVSTELREVTVSGADDPAHRIIRRAWANRRENDGMKYRAHRYVSYGKTVLDPALDSAVVSDTARLAALDTSTREVYGFAERQHLLLIESVTKKSFIPPDRAREEVLSMRVSGLKDPAILTLLASTETFSIYAPEIRISDKTYLGPLGPAAIAKYRFNLEDTLYQGPDSVYVISYRPRTGAKFNALEGLLYINTDGYAVQDVTAGPAEREGTSIRLQQVHQQVATPSGAEKWFPTQLNTFIYFDNMRMNNVGLMATGRVYLKHIEVDADVAGKEVRGPAFVADRMNTRRDDAFWDQWRVDSLDQRDLKTYARIDSIGDSLKFDQKLRWAEAFFSGRLRMGRVDLPLGRLVAYNAHEGIRLGAGVWTNERLWRHGAFGCYFAYGFTDKVWKYGGDLTFKPVYGRDLHIRLAYANDVAETGGVDFTGYVPGFLQASNYRLVYVDRMDRIERFSAQVMARAGSSLKLWIGTERTERINTMGYRHIEELGDGLSRYTDAFLYGAITLDLRWAYREKLARLAHREIAYGTKFPVVYVNLMRAVPGLWGGTLDTWRASAMAEKSFRIRPLGRLSVRLLGGIADPRGPMPFLFNLRGTYGTRDLLLAGDNAFETMRPNEFLADRYATLHLKHVFPWPLYGLKWSRPVPALVTSLGTGALERPQDHGGLPFNPMAGLYTESGIRLDGLLILRGMLHLGAGAFYRYGEHALPTAADNWAFKLTAGLRLE